MAALVPTGDALKEAMKPKLECPMPKVEPTAPQIGAGISCHAPVVVPVIAAEPAEVLR